MAKILRRHIRARKYRNRDITRRLNIHNFRVSLVKYRKIKKTRKKIKS